MSGPDPSAAVRRLFCAAWERAPPRGPAERARLATVLLHYALSAAAVPTQRACRAGGAEVDVAVPGLRGLGANPRSVVLVCIPANRPAPAGEQLAALRAVQPVAGNVWAVADSHCAGHRTYDISSPGGSFCGLLGDARAFAAEVGASRLGLLGSRTRPRGP